MTSRSLIAKINRYLKNYRVLDRIEDIQRRLKPPVDPREQKIRVRKLLRIRDKGRKILNEISRNKSIPDDLVNRVNEIIDRADHLKRENCLLQIPDFEPVGIIKPDDLCIFEEISRNNMVEIRKYYSLHKNLYYDEGLCISMAFTQSKLLQNYHSHLSFNEHTLVLDGNILLKARIGTDLIRLRADVGDMIFVRRGTVHTLINKTNRKSLNATVKVPMAFSDRVHIDNIPTSTEGSVRIIRLKAIERNWGRLKHRIIREKGYRYNVGLMFIDPLKSLSILNDGNTTLYVVNGRIQMRHNGKQEIVSYDNLVFVKGGNAVEIKNTSEKQVARLYVVTDLNNTTV
ncbi:MAG TPA: hypothetical protein EYP86_02645 [Candidatus Altiarchaeales archaeon]|nr:hypothetical protein [Candidatus Altiarchaeales archaeon]